MNVALAIDTLDAAKGGAERGISALGLALSDRGHAVTLVCAKAASPDPRWEVRTVKRPSWPRFRQVRRFAGMASALLQNMEASVVFGDVPGGTVYLPHGGVWSAWRRQEIAASESRAEARARARMIDASPRQRAARDLELATIKHPRLKGVIALSHMVQDNLRYAAEYQGPVAVIPNGIILPTVERPVRKPGPPRLLFVAHNFRLKGLAPFIHLLSRIPEAEGLVAGRGRPFLYRRLAAKLGCAKRLHFLGGIADMEGAYAAADVLLQPTFYDPCSLTTLEALARGLPVVSSRLNGAAELIGKGGAVIDDPRDAQAFANAVAGILNAPPGEIQAAARKSAEAVAEPGQTLKAVAQIEAWNP